MPFTIKDVLQLFEKKERATRGVEAYRYVSKILKEAKELHRQYFLTTSKIDMNNHGTLLQASTGRRPVNVPNNTTFACERGSTARSCLTYSSILS